MVSTRDKQVAVLLTAIEGETYPLSTSLLSPAKPHDKTYTEITAVLKAHFEPKPFIIVERFHFHRQQQGANESIAEYMAELRHLSSTREFNDYLDQALKDRMVCGLRHEATQKRLVTELRLMLLKAIEIVQSLEAAKFPANQRTVAGSPERFTENSTMSTKAGSCSQQEVRNTLPAAPLHPWLWPTKPWRRIHVDFAEENVSASLQNGPI